jgi:hypothetical protein
MANEFKIKKGLIVTGASGGTVVDIQGSQGQLFSVTDDLSGSIFAVSDISGVPILDVNSSGTSLFTGLVSGITPVDAANFVTKAYVDGSGGGTGPFLPLAGGTLTGSLISTENLGSASIYINSSRPSLGFTDTNSFPDPNDIYLIRGTSGAKLAFQFYDDSTGTTTETFSISPEGNSVFQNTLVAKGNITSQTAGGAGLNLRRDDTSISGTNTLGSIAFQGDDPTDGTFNNGAAIFGKADGSWSSNAYPGQLLLQTRNTTGGLATALTLAKDQNATFGNQAFATTATSSGDASSTLTTKGYVDGLITGATIYRGAWDPSGGGYGSPDLSGVTQTSGYYYICSAAGTAEPNGTGCEPDSWETGDWVIWNDDIVDCAGTGTGGWQKIDNSSVLSGVGTGQTVALWEGPASVTDSETLGNAPITVSGSDTTFAGALSSGNITVSNGGVPQLTLRDSGNGGGGGASGKIIYSNTAGNTIGLGYTADVTSTSDFIISTDAGSTYGGYLGLDAAAIVDPSSIIIDPKTNVYITKALGIGVKTPNDLLDIHNSATGAVDAQMNFTTAATGTGTSDGFRVGWNGTVAQMYLFEDADMRFATNNSEKMTITSAGGISFGSTGTAYGTAGQILKSNSDASPTWVDASTVIGGPYLPLTGGTMTGVVRKEYSSEPWSFVEATHRPLSIQTYSEAGSIGTTGNSAYTDVYGEADLSGIDNDATFTYLEAWQAVEGHKARLPTLAELWDGVGSGSGQSYDDKLLWTCTPAGPHHVFVALGALDASSKVFGTDYKIVDIDDSNEVYRTRAFYDVSRNGRSVSYSHDGALDTVDINTVGTITATAFAGDLTGIVTATSSLADGVTAATQTAANNSTLIATTAYADAAAAAVPIGNYLPLTAGSGEILTGDLAMNNNIGIITKDTSGAFRDVLKLNSSNILEIGSSSLTTNTIFKNTGNVGIGTTTPTTGKLVVEGDPYVKTNSGQARGGIDLKTNAAIGLGDFGAAISFGANGSGRAAISSVQGSSDADRQGLVFFTHGSGTGSADSAESMRISHDGKVGIASESPAALLDVSDRVYIDTYSSEASGNNPVISGYLQIRAGAKTGWGPDDQLGKIEFYGADSSGVGVRTAASILAVCETGNGTSTTTFSSGLAFYTSPYNAAQEERVRITNGGNLGIGTGADVYGDLHLQGGQQDIVLTNTAADGVANLTISRIIGQARGYSNNGSAMQSIDFVTNQTTWYKGDIVFKTNNTDGTDTSVAATEKMRIASNGNVGIGFTSPDSTPLSTMKLSVDGNGYFSGDLGIGTTSPDEKLDVAGKVQVTGTSLTVLNNSDPVVTVSDTDTNYRGSMRWLSSSNVLEFFTRYAGTYYTNNLVLDRGKVGIGTSTPNAKLDVQGTQGQLFSVTDDLSGSIFAVSDISGVPILDVNSNGTIQFSDLGAGTLVTDANGNISVSSGGGSGGPYLPLTAGSTVPLTGDLYLESSSTDVVMSGNGSGAFTIDNTTGQIAFKANGSTVQSMVITSSQISLNERVAVNTTTMNSVNKLEVNGQTRVVGSIMAGNASTGNTALQQIHIKNSGTAGIRLEDSDSANLAFDLITDEGTGFYISETIGGESGDNIRFIIEETTGNVGIGVNTPSYLLDVRDGTSSGAIARFAAINPHVIIESSTAGAAVLHLKPNTTGTKSGHFKVTAGNGYNFRWSNDAAGASEVSYMTLDTSTTGGGDLTVKGDVIAYGSPSDRKYKENIKPIESALDKAMQLQGVTFDWKEADSILDIKEDIGFIAQDVEKVLPELVRDSGKGNLSLRYQGITPILLEAIKELKAEIEELKKQIK